MNKKTREALKELDGVLYTLYKEFIIIDWGEKHGEEPYEPRIYDDERGFWHIWPACNSLEEAEHRCDQIVAHITKDDPEKENQ